MPLEIVRNDITKMQVDAIVNAANRTLLGGGGVDGAIHRAAGPALLAKCMTLGGCRTGEAKITPGYRLPCRYIIHTVGPVWHGGEKGEREQLESCYRSALRLAAKHGCSTVAFPLISSGIYGYPKDQALKVAADTIRAFLAFHEMTVYLVVFDKTAFQLSRELTDDIREYIDQHYVDLHSDTAARRREMELENFPLPPGAAQPDLAMKSPVQRPVSAMPEKKDAQLLEWMGMGEPAFSGLEAHLQEIDESFSQMLLRKIDEKGMTDAQCYKKANIDRKLFSKIRSDVHYKPSKVTALSFAIALELPLEQTNELLKKAGYALSHSNKFDLIVEYFIQRRNYDMFAINSALLYFDQNLLGV